MFCDDSTAPTRRRSKTTVCLGQQKGGRQLASPAPEPQPGFSAVQATFAAVVPAPSPAAPS
eukprot:9712472-Lingulodinium_polyedra.AAC.1